MKINYLGHSCFKITDGKGASVVCDPYDSSIGHTMPSVTSDIITVSHHHYDHDNVQAVKGQPKVIDSEFNGCLCGIEISTVSSFHDEVQGKARGKNLIFKLHMDGICVCHLGDLGERISSGLVQAIGKVNVLLIPVGGNYTIDAVSAKRYVDAIEPDIVIPMHYLSSGGKINIDRVDAFLKLFDRERVVKSERFDIEIDRGMLGGDTKVIVLGKN